MFKITHLLAGREKLTDSDMNLESFLNDLFVGSVRFDNGAGQIIETDWEHLPLLGFSMLLIDICGNLNLNDLDVEEISPEGAEEKRLIFQRKGQDRILISASFSDVVIDTGFKGFLRTVERFDSKLVEEIFLMHPEIRNTESYFDFYIRHFSSPKNSITRQGINWKSYI